MKIIHGSYISYQEDEKDKTIKKEPNHYGWLHLSHFTLSLFFLDDRKVFQPLVQTQHPGGLDQRSAAHSRPGGKAETVSAGAVNMQFSRNFVLEAGLIEQDTVHRMYAVIMRQNQKNRRSIFGHMFFQTDIFFGIFSSFDKVQDATVAIWSFRRNTRIYKDTEIWTTADSFNRIRMHLFYRQADRSIHALQDVHLRRTP